MRLETISLKDKVIFNRFLGKRTHELSVYSFANIYIWKALFDVSWALIKDSLCVFFRDNTGSFMYLPPLKEELSPAVVDECFRIMDRYNKNREVSRIENIEESGLRWYQEKGYLSRPKFGEYLCTREDLTGLIGNKFKSQRAAYNQFIKNYGYQYQPYLESDKEACLGLYSEWMGGREANNPDPVYRGMLKDSFSALKILLEAYPYLNLEGRVVRVAGKMRGFTFGFAINRESFCILYEVTDLKVRGLSQFIFRQFCRELENYRFINIMDDSGLENLKKTKFSYRPRRLVASYIVLRRDHL
ncbi:MAG TPA: phosphatidylglycerol lysyltransferase domain-containing protein [Candidatus Margulisiibacteriota bacterium]|nr:phosphatidylglycerol lysyltransferase domain-containing protein [Candidatus Margulisiibacteriota bacterium]